MKSPYDYLKPYVRKLGESSCGPNNFWPISSDEITKAEKDLNIQFPSQLRQFYEHIGYGFLKESQNSSSNYSFPPTNLINAPDMVAEILLHGEESGLIIDYAFTLLEPGDLPFFEIGDSTSFLLMKLNSDNPNAIWDYDLKICDSFEEFIWRLYYESPGFYGDVIADYLKQKQP